jgi:hypothetical protein
MHHTIFMTKLHCGGIGPSIIYPTWLILLIRDTLPSLSSKKKKKKNRDPLGSCSCRMTRVKSYGDKVPQVINRNIVSLGQIYPCVVPLKNIRVGQSNRYISALCTDSCVSCIRNIFPRQLCVHWHICFCSTPHLWAGPIKIWA